MCPLAFPRAAARLVLAVRHSINKLAVCEQTVTEPAVVTGADLHSAGRQGEGQCRDQEADVQQQATGQNGTEGVAVGPFKL